MTNNTMLGWLRALLFLFGATALFAAPVHAASVTYSQSGFSAKGTAVSFDALFDITVDTLTLTLTNTSTTSSVHPDDMLSSFYFDIMNGSAVRPTLTYLSATGDTYINNFLQTSSADLKTSQQVPLPGPSPATLADAWLFDTMDDTQAPFLGFGVGTVGNANLSPNGFNGSEVDGLSLSIYAGTLTSTNNIVTDSLLVKDSAVFVFSGLTGYTVADIDPNVVFGLGTAPDSTLPGVPVPAAVWLFGSVVIG